MLKYRGSILFNIRFLFWDAVDILASFWLQSMKLGLCYEMSVIHIVTDYILIKFYNSFYFYEKIRLDISCEHHLAANAY